MADALEDMLSRIETFLAEDEGLGRRVAHDFLDQLATEMETLTGERIELEQKIDAANRKPPGRTELVEEIAARLEKIAGRTSFVKELMDSIIERLYRLDPEERAMLANDLKGKT